MALSIDHADQHPLLSASIKSKRTIKVKIISVLAGFLILLTCTILTLYFLDVWPFDTDEATVYNDGPGGLFGEWPTYGGNLQNQQTPFNPWKVNITSSNIHNIYEQCKYTSINGQSFDGYIVIDDNNNAYWADYSGFITCINLDSCSEIWRKNIAGLLGYDSSRIKIVSRNSVTLYINNATKRKSLLLATPNKRAQSIGYLEEDPCWLLNIDVRTGNLIWKIDLNENNENKKENYLCHAHGFVVDNYGEFAYGGISIFGWKIDEWYHQNIHYNQFKGKLFKIDLKTHKIVDIFYTIPKDKNDDIIKANMSDYGYIGNGIWNFPLIIDDYLIFGTGDLLTYPDYISDCFNGDINLDPDKTYHWNPCGRNVINNSFWRCLESDIYTDSIVVLNRTTFDLILAKPLQGVDAWNMGCEEDPPILPCPTHRGPDADLVAMSVMKTDNNDIYVMAHQKSGMFYLVKLPSGDTLISKKVGPFTSMGGATSFSLAVDVENEIAITAITGYGSYKYEMADNQVICSTSSVHAIDLNTGYTLWQIVNPFGRIGENQCNSTIYDEYIDDSWEGKDLCQVSFNGSSMLLPNQTAINVVYPPIDDNVLFPHERARIYGGITIINDMVFIPSITGDIFIHNIINGSFIHKLQCPQTSSNNRPAIGGGVTVVNNRIVFYCGKRIWSKTTGDSQFGNDLISMKLPD